MARFADISNQSMTKHSKAAESVLQQDQQTPEGKTVQQYIDETPVWADGTSVSSSPMTRMQWRIWCLATAGKFFEGLVVFMTGVALPLIVKEFSLGAMEKGMVSAAPLAGILIGASALGGLADRFGRKLMFILEMVLFCVFLALTVFSPGMYWLVACLFGMGIALGCDYPTAHMVISESIPSNSRGKLVLSAFGFQAVGALAGTAVGYLILAENPSLAAWRYMYATAIIPAILVFLGRFFIPDSGHWLVSCDQIKQAEHELGRLLEREPQYPKTIKLIKPDSCPLEGDGKTDASSYLSLFKGKVKRATLLASLPWFLQDLGTYGIGIFTPTILASILGAETEYAHNLATLIHEDIMAAEGAALLDLLLLAGIILAVLLVDRVGRIKLQIIGFIGCAVGLGLAALSLSFSGAANISLIFAGFMIFNLMTNMGPNSMTYLIAGEVFPTHIRGKGAGFAASFAKVGAIVTAFLFPVLLKDLGTQVLLIILVSTSILGAVITKAFAIETTGVNLENIGEK